MNNWIPKKKIVRTSATALALGVILYFVGLYFDLGQIKKVENLYNSAESEFSQNEKLAAIKSIAGENQETIATARNFFVQKNDEVKFIEQIEGVAKNSGIKSEISAIDVNADKDKDSFKENLDIKMNVQGSWKNVMTFVNKLERLPFGVQVKNINLDASDYWAGSVEFIIFRAK